MFRTIAMLQGLAICHVLSGLSMTLQPTRVSSHHQSRSADQKLVAGAAPRASNSRKQSLKKRTKRSA